MLRWHSQQKFASNSHASLLPAPNTCGTLLAPTCGPKAVARSAHQDSEQGLNKKTCKHIKNAHWELSQHCWRLLQSSLRSSEEDGRRHLVSRTHSKLQPRRPPAHRDDQRSHSRLGSAVFKDGPECGPQQDVLRTRAPALFLKGTNSRGRGRGKVTRMRDQVHLLDSVGVPCHSSVRRPASPKRPPVGLAGSTMLAEKERAIAATALPHWRVCFLQQAQHLLG